MGRLSGLLPWMTLLAAWMCGGVALAADPLVLGVFPRFSATVVHNGFEPIARHLSEQLGREVILATAKDQDTFWSNLQAGRYDLVHYNQFHYIASHAQFGFDVVAMNEEQNKSTVTGVLMVRRDSKIRTLADLKGKSILFGGGRTAMVAYWANVATLQRAGLKRSDYSQEFARTPTNAILAVYYRQTEVGAAGEGWAAWPGIDGKITTADLRVLAESAPLPHLPWAVKRSLGSATAKKIQEALLSLNEGAAGRAILKSAGLTGIRAATDADYNSCRKLIREVGGG